MSYLDESELAALGFQAIGENVLISERASIYGAWKICLGNHVRIDDFCILSAGEGGIRLGSYIHIAAYSSIIGAGRVTIDDFANFSSRVSLYSSSDDYSGRFMTNPMVPDEYKQVDVRPVHVGRHVIIGSGSIILPGVTLHDGSAVAALSLVKSDCDAFGIFGGAPARRIGTRDRNLLELERKFLRKDQETE